MGTDRLRELLARYRDGEIQQEEMMAYLERLPFEDVSFAKIDHHRELRWGFPEVIYCQGKTPEQIRIIARRITTRGANVLATRADAEAFREVSADQPGARYNETARTISILVSPVTPVPGRVMIVTAGTSDIPVASEASETCSLLGLDFTMVHDIGVAGIHRLMHHQKEIIEASVVIVAAGMEGALASVVAGITRAPVIAVPTSTGYGASFHGIAALLSMLNSCVPGVAVMNIDNGFGAAFLAFKILQTRDKRPQ